VSLLVLYLLIIARCLYIASQAHDTYCRLLASSLAFTFFVYVFVNIGMVIGILPVVGVPLPLISYGGTSIVTLLSGFGILMSIHTHKKRLSR
jgi:rod shape determining protein RodA